MRAIQVGGVLLAVLCAPVVLAVAGASWLFVVILVVSGSAIFGAELSTQRAAEGRGEADDTGGWQDVVPVPPGGVDEASGWATGSDEELCWAWRRSFAELQRTTDPSGVARLAALRQGYLDELERRHPACFAKWISSGARAASDPHPFIRPRRTP